MDWLIFCRFFKNRILVCVVSLGDCILQHGDLNVTISPDLVPSINMYISQDHFSSLIENKRKSYLWSSLLCFASVLGDGSLPNNFLYWIPLSEAYIFHCNTLTTFSVPLSMQKSYLELEKRFLMYQQSLLEWFWKAILSKIKLYPSSI